MGKPNGYRIREFFAERTKSVQYPPERNVKYSSPQNDQKPISSEGLFLLFFVGVVSIVIGLAGLFLLSLFIF